MEQNLHSPEVYDFRQYDRIWQRVAPTLEPYPAMVRQSMGAEQPAAEEQTTALARQENQLPGAEENPCCMGSTAAEMLEVLTGFLEESREDKRQFLALARCAPVWARQTLREMAADEERHAGRLAAIYYLITGGCYRPQQNCRRITVENWCQALRERYHAEACNGLNFSRAAEETIDPCLRQLLEELSAEEYGHASRLLAMLERVLRG